MQEQVETVNYKISILWYSESNKSKYGGNLRKNLSDEDFVSDLVREHAFMLDLIYEEPIKRPPNPETERMLEDVVKINLSRQNYSSKEIEELIGILRPQPTRKNEYPNVMYAGLKFDDETENLLVAIRPIGYIFQRRVLEVDKVGSQKRNYNDEDIAEIEVIEKSK